jgi:hypothetical protein
MPRLWWLQHFPGGPELDASLYRPLATEIETFETAGFTAPDHRQVYEPARGTKAERLERLRHRSLSIFEHMSEEQLDTGFASLEREVAVDPDAIVPQIGASLLVLTRAG